MSEQFLGIDSTAFTRIEKNQDISSTDILKVLRVIPKNNDIVARYLNDNNIIKPKITTGYPVGNMVMSNTSKSEIMLKGTAFRISAALSKVSKDNIEIYYKNKYILQSNFRFEKSNFGESIILITDPSVKDDDTITVVHNPNTLKAYSINPQSTLQIPKSDPLIKNKQISFYGVYNESKYPTEISYTENTDFFIFANNTAIPMNIMLSKPVKIELINMDTNKTYDKLYGSFILQNTAFEFDADYTTAKMVIKNDKVTGPAIIRLYNEFTSLSLNTDLLNPSYTKPADVTNPANRPFKDLLQYPFSKNKLLSHFLKKNLIIHGSDLLRAGKRFNSLNNFTNGLISGAFQVPINAIILHQTKGLIAIVNSEEGVVESINDELVFSKQVGTGKHFLFIEGETTSADLKMAIGDTFCTVTKMMKNIGGVSIISDGAKGFIGAPEDIYTEWCKMDKTKRLSINLSDQLIKFDYYTGFDKMDPQVFQAIKLFNINFMAVFKSKIDGDPTYHVLSNHNFSLNNISSVFIDKWNIISDILVDYMGFKFLPDVDIQYLDTTALTSQTYLDKHILQLDNFIPEYDMIILNGKIIDSADIVEFKYGEYMINRFTEVIKEVTIYRRKSTERVIAKAICKFYKEEVEPAITRTNLPYTRTMGTLSTPPTMGTFTPTVSNKGLFDLFMREIIMNGRLDNICTANRQSDKDNLWTWIRTKFNKLSAAEKIANIPPSVPTQSKERIVLSGRNINNDIRFIGYKTKIK